MSLLKAKKVLSSADYYCSTSERQTLCSSPDSWPRPAALQSNREHCFSQQEEMNYIPLKMYKIFLEDFSKNVIFLHDRWHFFPYRKKERAFKELYVLVLSTEKQDLTLTAEAIPNDVILSSVMVWILTVSWSPVC